MVKKNMNEGIPIIGIGILGFIHEFIISDKPEMFPILLFGLLLIKGILLFLKVKNT